MRQLNGIYTQQVNRRHGLVGHLFQGRFKTILVERDAYLLELSRYVVLNPVRAGMVSQANEWAWSSYGAIVGLESPPTWLETDWILGQFGEQRARARARAGYAAFVAEGIDQPSVWNRLRHQVFLGSDGFAECHRDACGPLERLREVPARSAVRWPSRSRYLPENTPSGATPWRVHSRLASTPCRRSPTTSAYTTAPSAGRCGGAKPAVAPQPECRRRTLDFGTCLLGLR